MNRNSFVFREMGWVVGSIISLLLLAGAGGLAFFAQRTLGQTSAATLLLVLYLASWSYVLGIVGLIVSLAWWLLTGRHVQPARSATMIRYSPAELRRRRLEEPELEVPQYLEHNVVSAGPSRLSRHDRNEATSSTRVA